MKTMVKGELQLVEHGANKETERNGPSSFISDNTGCKNVWFHISDTTHFGQ